MHCGEMTIKQEMQLGINESQSLSTREVCNTHAHANSKEKGETQTVYLDKYKLLKGSSSDFPIKPAHQEWFIQQAAMLAQMKKVGLETKERLELLIMHAYSKISTTAEDHYDDLGIQTTPLLMDEGCYHRVTRNGLLERIYDVYSRFLELFSHEVFIIDSPLLEEIFTRELPHPQLNLNIGKKKDFEALIDCLFNEAIKGQFPEHRVLINFSKYLMIHPVSPSEFKQIIVPELEDILMKKLTRLFVEHPSLNSEEIVDKLLSKLHLVGFTQCQGKCVLLLPEFLMKGRFDEENNQLLARHSMHKRHGEIYRILDSMISRHGFRLEPTQAKAAWLKLQDSKAIFQALNIPAARLATRGAIIPTIFKSFNEFMQMDIVKQFKDLAKMKNAAPYLKVLPKATWRLLNGLAEYEENGGIQQEFSKRNLQSLLQISYFRMLNAMSEAILRKDQLIAFGNQIEILHQEIQNILGIVQPYNEQAFAQAVAYSLTKGKEPIVPKNLEKPKVHLKASAMRGLSSILASVEREKGDHHLNIAVLKDSYYYACNANLQSAKTYQLHTLDSNVFNKDGLTHALHPLPSQPIDLFVCEFHHNILHKQIYEPQRVINQIHEMVKQRLVAQKFTVVVDTTISFDQSGEMAHLLKDELIQTLIKEGKLNLVFLKSAQKFDMIGLDNYYGGIMISMNNSTAFSAFNERMNQKEDQLQGLSYQGLTHLQRYGSSSIRDFRQAVMSNTRKLYKMLPQKAIYHPGTKNPMQISQILDDSMFYLDIKFPKYPKTYQAFISKLHGFAKAKQLFFTARPSFCFFNVNLTLIEDKMRLAIGLESEEDLELYAAYIHLVQSIIDRMEAKNNEIDDELLAKAISTL